MDLGALRRSGRMLQGDSSGRLWDEGKNWKGCWGENGVGMMRRDLGSNVGGI